MGETSPAEQRWLLKEEARCVGRGAWRRVDRVRFCSRVFLVEKAGWDSDLQMRKKRLVIDLRPLNLHMQEFKTRYETLSQLGTLIADGETCAFLSFDLADAYACLQIRPEFQQYFGFNIQGRLYEMQALPFGWSVSPYAFCTAMKVLVRLLRSPDLPSVSQQQREQEQPDGAVA